MIDYDSFSHCHLTILNIFFRYFRGSERVKKVVNLDHQNYYLPVQQTILQPANGVTVGSPLAPLLADLCMNWIINEIKQIRPQRTLFYRYVEDCFALFSSQKEILKFYQQLNMIHPNVQFTYKASDNHQMLFLDVWINNIKGILKLSTYQKPTSTALYINWQSFVTFCYKLDLFKTMLRRGYNICNSFSLIHEDFHGISSIFKQNGYPLWCIDKK